MVIVKLFASFRERAKKEELVLDVDGEVSLKELIADIEERIPELKELLDNGTVIMAVNHKVASLDSKVKNEDEVAIFPPVSGG